MSTTTKIIIDSDEWYPVHSLREPSPSGGDWGPTREVPTETVERWKRVFAAFRRVQDEIEEVLKGPAPVPEFTEADWVSSVKEGITKLGYEEWKKNRIEFYKGQNAT